MFNLDLIPITNLLITKQRWQVWLYSDPFLINFEPSLDFVQPWPHFPSGRWRGTACRTWNKHENCVFWKRTQVSPRCTWFNKGAAETHWTCPTRRRSSAWHCAEREAVPLRSRSCWAGGAQSSLLLAFRQVSSWPIFQVLMSFRQDIHMISSGRKKELEGC